MAEKAMNLLDLSNEILLDILTLVDPVDLVNIYNVCERLRPLAERIINNVVLKLDLTGINCFPNLKHQPFTNLDRIRLNHNWLNEKFYKQALLTDLNSIWRGVVVDDENLYLPEDGAIRKYDRLWNGEYLSSKFEVIEEKGYPKIRMFAKKDDVLFVCYEKETCNVFQDGKPIIERAVVPSDILNVDLFPKNDIYVTASLESVRVYSPKPNNGTLLPVDDIPGGGYLVKIDPLGEKLIGKTRHYVTLYNFNTKDKEEFVGLDRVSDILWKDNQTVLSGHLDGSLRVLDLRTKSVCQKIDHLNCGYNVSIQFDGQNVVLCGFGSSKTVNICDLRMNKIVKELNIFNETEYVWSLRQIIADQKHLFVVTEAALDICDFSII